MYIDITKILFIVVLYFMQITKLSFIGATEFINCSCRIKR